MPRRISLFITWLTLFLVGHHSPADEPRGKASPPLDPNDPLIQALQELRREVEGLRNQVRGSRSESRSPAMTPKSRRRTSPKSLAPNRPTLQPARPAPTIPRTIPQKLPSIKIGRSTSEHWSFQPLQQPARPPVRDSAWIRDDLDRFILAKMEEAGLHPNQDADRYTLIRRVSFDLTGLPPSEAEIRDFVNDPASLDQSLARLVDRLLNSERFGERWGRHWLDVVRYADSVGRNWNAPFTYAWRYRNYVIDAFNKDKPYDRFITEQLAGDLLPTNDMQLRREQLTATSFLALGPTDIVVPEGEALMMDRTDEQIDVTSRAILGLTISCARCHDHKYEPITMRDYYALAGVFYSTRTLSGQRRGNYVADDDLQLLPSRNGETNPIPGVHSMADMTREFRNGGWREVFWTTDPNLAMGATEGRVQDCPIRIDGAAYKRGPIPHRGDFNIAGMPGLKNVSPTASGRLQLARWIVAADNPLTARVMVNRIWLHLFGQGLVHTPDNFGKSGEEPTHPELLDHLAVQFQQTWSVKSLIRSIVLSHTYRQSSSPQTAGLRVDPQNNLYWRMNVRRLEMEAIRDTALALAGRLTFARPDGIQIAGTGGKGRWGITRSLLHIDSPYRTVYLPVLRSLLPEMYQTFDFPNPTQVKGQREVTTVAPQSLFLMNSEFATACARDAARRLLDEPNRSDGARIQHLYLQMLGRLPDNNERDAALSFLQSLSADAAIRDVELYRWSALIQALMITGEFRSLL